MTSSHRQPLRLTAALLLAVCLLSTVDARMQQHNIRMRDSVAMPHLQQAKRQILGGAGDTGTNQQSSAAAAAAPPPAAAADPTTSAPAPAAAAPTSQTAAAVQPSSQPADTGFPLSVLPAQPATTSSTAAAVAPADSSNAAVPSLAMTDAAGKIVVSASSIPALAISSAAATSSSLPSSAATRSSATADDSTPSDQVINITSTALVNASATASSSVSAAAASASSKSDDNGGGGLNKTSLIAIIAIASSIGLIAAAWTIFRKWKLSPSRSFEDKLTPIDWSPEMAGAHRSEDKLALTRSNSTGSGVSSLHKGGHGGSQVGGGLRRQPSWGSAHGSQMSEVPYNATPAYASTNGYPAYAEQSPYQQQSQRAASPYENLSRQPTGFTNGGRYGEGYTRNNY